MPSPAPNGNWQVRRQPSDFNHRRHGGDHMFNKTAKPTFDEQIRKVLDMPPNDLVGAESELCYAAGMVSYALMCGDITHAEASLMNHRISSARSNRVARLCRNDRLARATA
jgi:hypothetical protein